ncbi:hypothetical protein [Chryseobacterium sp.]|uniref:hypothetical protein n=1 Tax=Chryseobacterium sp. TaxID=1871047 RepID=UPI002899DDF1|nr:hypothetical protein [Chryseobacterium sp.]
MKKLIVTVFTAASIIGYSQSNEIANLRKLNNAEVSINQNTGLPNFLRFPHKPLALKGKNIKEKSEDFIAKHYKDFNLDSPQDLVFVKEFTDNYGLKNIVYAQVYKGINVF